MKFISILAFALVFSSANAQTIQITKAQLFKSIDSICNLRVRDTSNKLRAQYDKAIKDSEAKMAIQYAKALKDSLVTFIPVSKQSLDAVNGIGPTISKINIRGDSVSVALKGKTDTTTTNNFFADTDSRLRSLETFRNAMLDSIQGLRTEFKNLNWAVYKSNEIVKDSLLSMSNILVIMKAEIAKLKEQIGLTADQLEIINLWIDNKQRVFNLLQKE